LVVRGHDEPWRECRTGCGEAGFIGLSVARPELSVGHVRRVEFPVLLRIVDARDKALALLVLRQMQEDLDDPGAVAMEVLLHSGYRVIAILPQAIVAGAARPSP